MGKDLATLVLPHPVKLVNKIGHIPVLPVQDVGNLPEKGDVFLILEHVVLFPQLLILLIADLCEMTVCERLDGALAPLMPLKGQLTEGLSAIVDAD